MESIDLIQALALQVAWGADEAIDPVPINRMLTQASAAQADTPIALVTPFARRDPVQAPAVETQSPRALAEIAAAGANSLAELRQAIAGFAHCPLRDSATNLVFCSGNPDFGLLLVGDAPGSDDDRHGVPISGKDGQLLDQMLASIRLSRGELLLTPLLPWRPPGGRPPAPAEIETCLPFLLRLLALTKPHLLVLLGPLPVQSLLGKTRSSSKAAWIEEQIPNLTSVDAKLPVLVLPALASIHLTSQRKREAWSGLRLLRRRLDRFP